MKHPLFLAILLVILGYSVKSQNLETIKNAKPFQYHGTIQASGGGYTAIGIENRRNPYIWSLSGNPTFYLYDIEIPFSFLISEQNRSFRQPFNQFGLSPTWKWITLHGGYRNLTYSNYTLNGHTFLGVGLDLNPKWFRFSAMYGRFQKAIEEDTTDIANNLSQYTYPAYKRKGFATKIGFGKENNFVDLVFTKIWDDSTSLTKKPEKEKILPGNNSTIGIVAQTTFLKNFTWNLDAAMSALTKDITSSPYDLDDVLMGKIAKILVPGKLSTVVSYALETSLRYNSKPATVVAKYQRIAPEYESFGMYFIQSDLERVTIAPSFRMFKNKLNLGGSYGFQRDNLKNNKLAATKRMIGSANVNYNASQKFGVTFNYSNFGTTQSPGTKSLNDTTKINQISHSVMLVPRITLMKDNSLMHNIILMAAYQNLNDRNKLNSTNFEMKNTNINLNYMIGLLPQKVNLNVGVNTNYNILSAGKTMSYGFSTGANYTFGQDKITFSEQFSWNKNSFNKASNGSTLQNSFNLSYQFIPHNSISANLLITHNKAIDETINPTFTEFMGLVTYSLTY
jgi:hypothetical protein